MNLKVRLHWLFLCLALLVPGPAANAAAQETRKPNIVFILVDNLGYGDTGAYGGGELRGAPTPRIDQLAREGLRLTNFNVEPECTPSRAALMTGRMPIRSGLDGQVANPGSRGGLSPWEVTLPELLKQAGYRTAMYGKWHLGEENGRLPNDQGFDEWWGFPKSSGDTLRELQPGWSADIAPQQPLMEGLAGQASKEVGVYDLAMRPLMDGMITEKSVAYILDQTGSTQPFFLYVPFSLPHTPPLPNPKFADKSKTEYQNVLREIDANTGAILDFYATFAHLVGVENGIPRDRAIDSIDQSDLFLGAQSRSRREHVMFFYDSALLAVKWRNYKVHLQVRNPAEGTVRVAGQGVTNGYVMKLNYPWIFNLENDPKELWNMSGTSEWLGQPVTRIQTQYYRSVARFPNLKPGQDKPAAAAQ